MIVEIRVVERAGYRKELAKFTEETMRGKTSRNVVVMTPEMFAKSFSAKRLEMLMRMSKDKSISVSELARKLDRRYEVVYRDLRYFENLGLVRLVQGERNSLIPELAGQIRMAVPLSG